MNKKIAVKSSLIGVICTIVTNVIGLFYSRYFLQYIGIEIRGLSEVLNNCIGLLSLTELGVGTAITYGLYQPLVDGDVDEVKALMQLYSKLYKIIGVLILGVGIVASFFLNIVISNTTLSWSYVRVVFYLQLAAAVSTYFMAYKRNLLYADKRMYVTTLVDSVAKVVTIVVQMIVVITIHSYVLVLLLAVVQTIIANVYINNYCNKIYPFLKEKEVIRYSKIPELKNNIKNIMIGQVGGFVYNSTDNLIISAFVGVVEVGFMSYYYQIRALLVTIVNSACDPIAPIIGNHVHDNKTMDENYQLFLSYTFIRYCMANILCVGMITMVGPLIEIWLGAQYVLEISIPILMLIDTYIGVVHSPTREFIHVLGLFRDDKNMSLIGMCMNLVISIICVKLFGTMGVLIGTAVSQVYYWSARGFILFKQYFKMGVFRYLGNVIVYTLVCAVDIVIMQIIRPIIMPETTIFSFIYTSLLCVCVSVLSLLVFSKTKEFMLLKDILLIVLNKIRGKRQK